MAGLQEDDEGFQVVKKKKGRQNIKTRNVDSISDVADDFIDTEGLKVKLWQSRQELKPSDFIQDLKETWKLVKQKLESDPAIRSFKDKMISNDSEADPASHLPPELLVHLGQLPITEQINKSFITSIICYGLGNFSTCAIARYQLGFLLLLSNMVLVPHSKCFCYDPRFTKSEIAFLKDLGLEVIKENEEGKRVCKEPTLLFMPHCGKPLYNNALWANWGNDNLHNLIILGNSFSSFHERIPEARLFSEASYIAAILPFTTEEKVKNNFKHTDIFNDMAFHIFNSERMKQVPNEIWEQRTEPSYDHIEDLEIILKKERS
ncbi:SRR1-like protein isoform X3 [Apostichopus japonicus]|uniref:SRR1-like protein isoform X3 n=1 Tax=Stichopus japonicus TaxID=307972 RepID=UPI003AB54D1D